MVKLTHRDIKSHQIIVSISTVLTTSQTWLVAILNFESRVTASSRRVPRPLLCVYMVLSGSWVFSVCFVWFQSPVPVQDHMGTQLAPARSRGMIRNARIEDWNS